MGMDRRGFLRSAGLGATAAAVSVTGMGDAAAAEKSGSQRLSLKALQRWEALHYGMFIHFGMSTFVVNELPDGKTPAKEYSPDRLDVDQWVMVARDAGMKYAVLTTKHVAGHCLWPSKHTDYTVAASGNTTDVVEQFVRACEKRGVKPGFYYCSWDNHNRFGSHTPSDGGDWKGMNSFPKTRGESLPPYTTSLYQTFQTAQITELLTQYGSIAETWIDIPGMLGRGFRAEHYRHIASVQPETVIMMNSGISDGSPADYDVDYAWPSDLVAIERKLPPESGHRPWWTIEGKEYYVPGEICDPIGKEWFHVPGDVPRPDKDLLNMYTIARNRNVSLLLDVPPDRHGLIPEESVQALTRLRKNAGL